MSDLPLDLHLRAEYNCYTKYGDILMDNSFEIRPPEGVVDVVLDTDAYNEIDDQFAISFLLASPEKANIQAFYAAPFLNSKSVSPKDGMEKSYEEILHLLKLAHRSEYVKCTFPGSDRYMPDEKTPVISAASKDLAERAMKYTVENPLYVLEIAAITNVASAIVMNPDIVDRIVLVWLGGHSLEWPDTREFNMYQDVAAARVVYHSGVRMVQLPCCGVVDMLRTTKPELEYWLRGKNELCDYLINHTIEEADSYARGRPWSRVIWDISSVAWLLNTNGRMMCQKMIPAPITGYDNKYETARLDHKIAYVWTINRDQVFSSLFNKLAELN